MQKTGYRSLKIKVFGRSGGVLLDQSLEKTRRGKAVNGADSECGQRKPLKPLTVIILTLATLALLGAGYILFNYGGDVIDTYLGNVKGELTGIDYEAPSEPLVPREEISLRPVVTNTGDVSIFAFFTVTVPYNTVDGEIVEWYDLDPASVWTQIDRKIEENTVTYVYAYESDRNRLIVLQPTLSTESLFNDDHKLTVGAIGLLSEADRTDVSRSKVKINYHVCQSRMMDGLSDSQVFESTIAEEGGL